MKGKKGWRFIEKKSKKRKLLFDQIISRIKSQRVGIRLNLFILNQFILQLRTFNGNTKGYIFFHNDPSHFTVKMKIKLETDLSHLKHIWNTNVEEINFLILFKMKDLC